MSIPSHLRAIVGRREFFFSLRTKDRAEAKRRVLQVEASHYNALLEQAQTQLDRPQQVAPSPTPSQA